jgi:ADP-ribosylglycohydrolase
MGSLMTRCGATVGLDGQPIPPCQNPINLQSERCAAGHTQRPGYDTARSVDPASLGACGAAFDMDDLVYQPLDDELNVERWGQERVDQTRIEGALLGVAAGDALGATVEFRNPAAIAREFPNGHRDIIGGGSFGWRAGQGTDDSDLTMALARAYADEDGFSVKKAADNFLAWRKGGPRDIGGTTSSALRAYENSGDPLTSGRTDERSAANGSLMRCIATGLVRVDEAKRRQEAIDVSKVTHGERRCLDATAIYCDVASQLMDGKSPDEAIDWALANSPVSDEVKGWVSAARTKRLEQLDTSGYVLGSLECSIWAISQDDSLENTLVRLVSRGNDADTYGAIAGGLLGAAHGPSAIPARWRATLEYAPEIHELAPKLNRLRQGDKPAPPAHHVPAVAPR